MFCISGCKSFESVLAPTYKIWPCIVVCYKQMNNQHKQTGVYVPELFNFVLVFCRTEIIVLYLLTKFTNNNL